jgi:enamine deaminase RidA (YjgF/YER057c/UK114 family)
MNFDFFQKRGWSLPEPKPSLASYQPFRKSGQTIYISGQLPWWEGKIFRTGKLGESLTTEEGYKAAEISAWNALAYLISPEIRPESIEILKLTVFVACVPSFQEHHLVANGASEFFFGVFGEKGKHARSSVGVTSLPLDSCVEVELICSYENK